MIRTAVLLLLFVTCIQVQGMVQSNSLFFSLNNGESMSEEEMGMMMAEIEDDSNEQGCVGSAVYQVKVDFVWSAVTHPVDYPSNAHWSPFAVTTHNSNYRMWGQDLMASPGVQQVAETGNSTILGTEIDACGDDCTPMVTYPCDVMAGTCLATGKLEVPSDRTRFSGISMIAPSPDWFVGIHDLELCKFGSWVTKFQAPLRGFDAGTDSGVTYLSEDEPTDPATLITIHRGEDSILYNPEQMTLNPFGELTIELLPEEMMIDDGMAMKDVSDCEGTATYIITADFVWSANTHPTDYPAGQAMWSPLSGTTHNKDYSMWRAGVMATPGVQQVAETGNNTILGEEIDACGEDCTPMFAFECDQISGTCISSGSIDVGADKPYLSAVSMIAPSPDWFVGVHDVPLCVLGSWKQELSVNLFAHDAGTDSGNTYLAENVVTMPAVNIFRILDEDSVLVNPTEMEILPFGTFTILLDSVA